jgi:ketosteroid isomerase-like protein
VVVTEPGKTARGVSELRSFFERVIRSGGSAKQLKTEVLEADGIALFISRWNFQVPNADSEAVRRTFVATTVFRKQPDGEWKILIDNPFGPLILGAE